ncbi:hypothetical protein [Tsukamurella pseudospumae]|uniref:Uncharacterized protein n=1 Tax=Tsukamurella pseudospumae TaxID=239498 RepID=A0A138AWE9_9ACTN|nr:hypothetical protein [Tsukamurella pseudospumae]KXP01560.1 hypothetical protein AXK61_01805 [Tsukamurella pseudospumae]KXP14775.1 hypothetical protein AXK60_02520 [Tsukamurella pseudospumae]
MLETLIRWAAFFGGWLLVAGPLVQSRLELDAEASELSGIRATVEATAPPSRLSRWWWLFPPVAVYLTRRRQAAYVATLREVLTAEQMSKLAHFFAVARAWLLVASGAALIALKETYELSHHQHWEPWGFWALTAFAVIAIGGLNTATWKRPDSRT